MWSVGREYSDTSTGESDTQFHFWGIPIHSRSRYQLRSQLDGLHLEASAKCENCRGEIFEKTLIEPK
jgi:hypothetical protein